MVDVGGRPVLWHIMKNLGHYGINDFIVATGYKSDVIKEYFLNYEALSNDFTIELGKKDSLEFYDAHDEANWRVTVAYTGEDTPTGGRVHRASKYLDNERFLVTYGDGLADVDITALRRFHDQQGTLATVTTVQPFSRFGVMDVGDNQKVRDFREKPQLDGWINIGFFIMEPAALGYLAEDSVLEEEPLAQLAKDGQLSAFRHAGFWQPMDTYRENRMLNEMWETGTAPWQVWS